MNLATLLCRNSERSTEIFIENGGFPYLIEGFNSGDNEIRVEALNALETISEFEVSISQFHKYNLLMRTIILLEEGLQMCSQMGDTQAISSLQIIRNYSRVFALK